MSDIKNNVETVSSAELRVKAKALGIKFTKNTSDDTLISKIEAIENNAITKQAKGISESRNRMALRRVIITPRNPLEHDLPAKFITIANRYITVRKAVQFGTEIFLEQCVIDSLKEAKYLHIYDNTRSTSSSKMPDQKPKTELRPAYGIEYLHTPTEQEWKNDTEWKAMREKKALTNAANKEGA